ncbi:MAG: ABC transporter ATP-binding protein [Desulfuromonadales bacterium]
MDQPTEHADPAIRVVNLSKYYQIYDTPRDRLKQFVLPRLRRAFGRKPMCFYREFWALREVAFTVARGETLGIVGRNGSGKSTLLQLICGTLAASAGAIETRGRVAALLELGAGFNPEFTGRENVYMAASLYGLSRPEINARFAAIAAFADIGDFIEQPVKMYSSGMYVRLAFAVIAHVDADILVIDEALSVGDALFTQKCMRFIRQFQKRGTLLFVSHDMSSVINLCRSAIWLEEGRIRDVGPAKKVADEYLRHTLQELYGDAASLEATNAGADEHPPAVPKDNEVLDYHVEGVAADNMHAASGWQTGGAQILGVRMEPLAGGQGGVFLGGEKVRMLIRARARQPLRRPILGFLVRDRLGQDLFGENTLPFTDLHPTEIAAGQDFEGEFVFRLPMLPNGQYAVMASVADGDLHHHIQHHWLHDAMIINISSSRVRWGLVGVPFERVSLRSAV